MTFDFYNPVRMISGEGCVVGNAAALRALGTRCMIVTSPSAGRKSGALNDVIAALADMPYTVYDGVQQNPLLDDCHRVGELARAFGADFIVGIGGGSPLDAAKAVAVFAANPELDPEGLWREWQRPPLPFAAVGTTAGTGSEVGGACVLTLSNGRKKSIATPLLIPQIAFGDSKYTMSLPLGFTISTALDSLAHAVEGYFSLSASALSDVHALAAMRILSRELPLLLEVDDAAGISFEMRESLYFASILAGLTLAKCGTAYCHNLGYYLTEEHGFAHGTACAVFLPGFLERGRTYAPEKAAELEIQCGMRLDELCGLIQRLNTCTLPKLSAAQIDDIAERGAASTNFARTLPSGLTRANALGILHEILG